MAEWKVIAIDREQGGSREILGATYAMKVPGGMLIRTFNQTGCAMAFVPMEQVAVAPNVSYTDQWISDNKIEHK